MIAMTTEVQRSAAERPKTEGWRDMTEAERKETLRRAVEVQVAEHLSNATMARVVLKSSPAVWSQIRSGTYQGSTDKWLRRAEQWLADRQERQATPETEFAETSIARRILAVCERAWSMPTIGRVITPSGCGKTMALREFARRRGETALFIQAGEFARGVGGVLGEIARGLGIPVTGKASVDSLGRAVRANLAEHYSGGIRPPFAILVDEATTLTAGALNVLRNLHDDPASRAAIVLADTWRLDAFLRSAHGIAGGNEQLRTRGGAVCLVPETEEIARDDVRKVAEMILAGLGHEGGLPRLALDYLTGLANQDGRLRNVYHRLHACHDVALARRWEPSYSVAELDYVGPLVGMKCEQVHDGPPFAARREAADEQKATA